jgi:ADP-heptose:LPS heptosyltransferase
MKSFNPAKIKSILIIQLSPFGDVLLNTSYLNALRNKFPTAKIDFLVSEPYNSVLYKHPALSELVTFKKKKGSAYAWERLKVFVRVMLRRYDLVIDQQAGTGSGQVVLFSLAKYRLGFEDSRFAPIYNLVARRGVVRYSASQKFDLLVPLGIKEEPYKLYYYIKDESIAYIDKWLAEVKLEDRGFICFSPGSPAQRKIWDLKLFAELADRLQENTGLPIVILWALDEKADAETMLNHMKNKAFFAPPTSLNEAAAMLKRAKLLVCNDGGMNHISVATETPSLAMFGPTLPIYWCPGPVFKNHASLSHPHAYDPKDKSFGITVEEAYTKAMKLLSQ